MAANAAVESAGQDAGVWTIERGQPEYPASLALLGEQAPARLAFLGDPRIWRERRGEWLGLLSSVRCPGDVILKVYDLAVALRDAGAIVAGGYHAPMEQEVLRLLLRGAQPVIALPARGLETMRPEREQREALAEGRLLLVSPFPATVRRSTGETALYRNRVLAALADALLVTYAQPGGKTEAVVREALGWGKAVHTLDSPANANLLGLGVRRWDMAQPRALGYNTRHMSA